MDTIKMPSMDSVARFKAAMDSDQGALGPFMITSDPAYVEAAGYAGYDFVLLDMEHGPGTFENLQNLIRAANVSGVCPVVRVPRGTDIWVDRALDAVSYTHLDVYKRQAGDLQSHPDCGVWRRHGVLWPADHEHDQA